ncbi:MAG: Xaa-Pro peptidase family protein, partial [Nitrososphaera sp.]|nr:Xaa-Pro peptidase family protein [Nitrososphaera sp.]
RELGVFLQHNTNSAIEAVLLNPLLDEARKLEEQTSTVNKLALLVFRKYELLNTSVEVPTSLPLDMADFLRSKGVMLVPKSPFFPERLIKKSQEVAAIRDSLLRTHVAFQRIEEILKESSIQGDELLHGGNVLTSEFLKQEVDRVLLEKDMLNVEGMIISCGRDAAIPHHRGHGPIRPHQTIVCDIFPRRRETGYFADMTRTYVKGEPSQVIAKLYSAVQRAQEASVESVRAGVIGREAYEASANIFRELGYDVGDKGFVHDIGHGLGLDVHEERFADPIIKTTLQAGNVITIEPGLYYPEIGGVRIEDVVHVTESGYENLTNYPKEFVIP